MTYSKRGLLSVAMTVMAASLGCSTPAPPAEVLSPAFETIALTSSNSYGGGFYAGILVVSHATGAISACWKKCTTIGKMEPTKSHDLVLNTGPLGRLEAHITNVTTGHVVSCTVETDGWVTKFEKGSCSDVGIAER